MKRPERRNRKIGTSASGHGQSNYMRVPESWLDKHGNTGPFWERVTPDYETCLQNGSHKINVYYELPRQGFSYGCSPLDIKSMFDFIQHHVPAYPDMVLFRQPTRKQSQLNPVWGRFLYFAKAGSVQGTAIVLESQKIGAPLIWPRKMDMDDRDEFLRLQKDGHVFKEEKRSYVTALNEDTIRNTVLYRTLLHEFGHFVQYFKDVRTNTDENAWSAYISRAAKEREAFANKFANNLAKKLRDKGVLPFDPLPFKI